MLRKTKTLHNREMIGIIKFFSQLAVNLDLSFGSPIAASNKIRFWVPRVAIIRTTATVTSGSEMRARSIGIQSDSSRNINGLLSLCVCCSGSAGESAGRRGSRISDLAIPAQVTRGPRPRLTRRKRRGQLRLTGPPHTSGGGGERRAWCGTPARHYRQQATVGGMDTSEQCSRYD